MQTNHTHLAGVAHPQVTRSFRVSSMPIPADLRFDAGSPPPQWLTSCDDSDSRTRALHLWETTMGLIHNENSLSGDPERFLAMINDHRVSRHRGVL